MLHKMSYRIGLDLGTSSIGWALIRLNENHAPCAIIKTGVRIFSDGRNPNDGSSLAVTRREARGMRRRRDRLLKRKQRMMKTLIELGFFSSDDKTRQLEKNKNPYELRAKGLDDVLTPSEFARACFHINQRRGFKSNRKTDKKENDSGALKLAINTLRANLKEENCRTVGEWLYKRQCQGLTVRARYRENKMPSEQGKTKIIKSYDLYIDRAMIEDEFDRLWDKQAQFNAQLFNEGAKKAIKGILLFQRNLKPVTPGKCTLIPTHSRAPQALPITQQFRIIQEVNNLRIINSNLQEQHLTLDQRNAIVDALEKSNKCTFTQIKKILGLCGAYQFNLEDIKRTELKGNATSATLSKPDYFGEKWFSFDESLQNQIVLQLVTEENAALLIKWLQENTSIDETRAERIADVSLPEGYGRLSYQALLRIVPALKKEVISFDKAAQAAGFESHSNINFASTGEILDNLPYYGIPLERHVGFGSGEESDTDEKRYGRIANPTVHIGLNQIRLVINALIQKYGHPTEVIIEVARALKNSKDKKDQIKKQQTENQKRNTRIRSIIAQALGINQDGVSTTAIQKVILWEELSNDPLERRCPYSGVQISLSMLLSNEVEIEHILPFSITLDDSLNNKTVALRNANRVKGNKTPWQAFGEQIIDGYDYAQILSRAEAMKKEKKYRFAQDGYQRWLKEDAGFLARALNDTKYLSKVAKDYVQVICPKTRVIPGQMTAMLRQKFGLNTILGLNGVKNRNDHRHHAVDACVIAITDQGMLQKFAKASADARDKQLTKLVETMPLPWETYREHVARAINTTHVSHKPDHSHEGAMHNDTAYGIRPDGYVVTHKIIEGKRVKQEEKLTVIPIASHTALERHGMLEDGSPKPYKGYEGHSNYCIEIVINDKNKWQGQVISTFEAYQIVKAARKNGKDGVKTLRHPKLSNSGMPLVMRLMINDTIQLKIDNKNEIMRICKISSNGQITLAKINEANVAARSSDKGEDFSYISKVPSVLQKMNAKQVTVSPIGEIKIKRTRG